MKDDLCRRFGLDPACVELLFWDDPGGIQAAARLLTNNLKSHAVSRVKVKAATEAIKRLAEMEAETQKHAPKPPERQPGSDMLIPPGEALVQAVFAEGLTRELKGTLKVPLSTIVVQAATLPTSVLAKPFHIVEFVDWLNGDRKDPPTWLIE